MLKKKNFSEKKICINIKNNMSLCITKNINFVNSIMVKSLISITGLQHSINKLQSNFYCYLNIPILP